MYRTQHLEEVESTQDLVFEFLSKEPDQKLLLLADHQIQGRGRRGRVWTQEKGKSLSLSLGLQLKSEQLSGLSLIVGLALLEAVQKPGLQLKWPNDLMIGSDKVGGVLVESRSQSSAVEVAIGIGLNLFDFDSFRGIGRSVDPHLIAQTCFRWIEEFADIGFSEFRSDYEAVMWGRGEWVRADLGGDLRKLKLNGVSDEGLIRVEAEDGSASSLSSGEIRVERFLS